MSKNMNRSNLKISKESYGSEFEYQPNVNLSAAHIGLPIWKWHYIVEKNEEQAKKIMRSKRYDILPVRDQKKRFKNYYSTRYPNNYDYLNLGLIHDAGKIYYRTSFRDLIKKIANEGGTHYFLINYEKVIGFITLADFNGDAVKNHLYTILSDMERSFCDLFRKHFTEDDVVEALKGSSNYKDNEVLNEYEKAKANNVDIDIYHHMYLDTIGTVLKKLGNKLPGRIKKLNKFQRKFGSDSLYNKIRNPIMHPVKSLVHNHGSIIQINELLNDYADIKRILLENLVDE